MSATDEESDQVEKAAADWRARLRGDDRPQTRAALEAWLAENPAHRAAYAAVMAAEAKAGLTTLPLPPLHPSRPVRRIATPAAWTAAIAASLVVCAVALDLRPNARIPQPEQEYAADARPRAFPLEGGADLILDAHSLVRGRADGRPEYFALVSGRARFSTPAGISADFAVSLTPLRVTARGGTFDVTRSNGEIRIVDVAGAVDVDRPGPQGRSRITTRLAPGDAFMHNADGDRIMTVDRREIRWTTAMLPLDGLTLGEVIAIGNRSGGRPIRLDDPTLAGMPLQGQLRAVDTAALAEQLAAAFDLALARDERGYALTRKK